MKLKKLIKELEDDGWAKVKQKGSHIQYKHPSKKGKVTVSFHGGNPDVPKGTEKSIRKQAGI